MSDKFQNKYRIPSARLRNWDYGWNAAYFITICTQNRECYFGEIVNKNMILSEIGTIVQTFWKEIPTHVPFVELGEFVVMPNHVHGIIIINKPDDGRYDETSPDGTISDGTQSVETPKLGVSTIPNNEIVPNNEIIPTNQTTAASEKWNPETMGVIINQYKRICTIHTRKIHADFGWQSRFQDLIIRNDESFQHISEYIRNNPANWRTDKFHYETESS